MDDDIIRKRLSKEVGEKLGGSKDSKKYLREEEKQMVGEEREVHRDEEELLNKQKEAADLDIELKRQRLNLLKKMSGQLDSADKNKGEGKKGFKGHASRVKEHWQQHPVNWVLFFIIAVHIFDLLGWNRYKSFDYPNRTVILFAVYVLIGLGYYILDADRSTLQRSVQSFAIYVIGMTLISVFYARGISYIPANLWLLRTFLLIFTTPWIWYFLLSPQDPQIKKWATIYILAFVFVALLSVGGKVVQLMDENIPQGNVMAAVDPLGDAKEFIVWMGRTIKTTFKGLWKMPSLTWNSVVNRTLGPEFFGSVEENENNMQLGVVLEVSQSAHEVFMEGQDVTVFGNLKGRTFVGPLMVQNECYLKVPKSEIRDEYLYIQGDMQPGEPVPLTDYEQYPLICNVPYQKIKEAGIDYTKTQYPLILFRSTFDFETWGYITYAFMDREQLLRYGKRPDLAAQQLGIPPYVQAVYTNGPVSLGLAYYDEKRTQPIAIERKTQTKVVPIAFGVTLMNQQGYSNQGKILKVNKLTYLIPKEFYLEQCFPVKFAEQKTDPENSAYMQYVFQNIEMQEGDYYITIRCTLKVQNADELLGVGGISLNTFAVKAEYTYRLEQEDRIQLEKLETQNE